MRAPAFVVGALLALPVSLTAQSIRLPRGAGGRAGTTEEPAPLPTPAPKVSQALAYTYSRWSAETYSLVDAVQAPAVGTGGSARYTTAGAGTHADYRFTDHVAGTVDLASTLPVGTSNTQTAELGARFSPLALDQRVRPFVDLRGAYVRMTDSFSAESGIPTPISINGSENDVVAGSRYSRGLGAVGGAGAEYSLTTRFALTTELSAMRNRMSTYRLTSLTNGPASNSAFWMTSYRFMLGLRFNPTSAAHMAQKATP